MLYETLLICEDNKECVAQYGMESLTPDLTGSLLHSMMQSAIVVAKRYTQITQPEGMTFKVICSLYEDRNRIMYPSYLLETNQEGDETVAYISLLP